MAVIAQRHALFGELEFPAEPGMFKVAYSKNFENKNVVNYPEGVKPYIEDFETEWVDYSKLKEIVIDNGWAIARPFEGTKSDETITHVSYIGLDFDAVSMDTFQKVKEDPFLKGRGFFHYSASQGKKPGINGHWICPVEASMRITSDEERRNWEIVLRQIVTMIRVGDKKGKDLQRLFYGAKDAQFEVWGEGSIGLDEIEKLYQVGKTREDEITAKLALAEANRRKRKRGVINYDFNDAVKLTRKWVEPQLDNRSFPDVGDMSSYEVWLGYFLGWSDQIGINDAAKLMDMFAPDTGMGSRRKLLSFKNGEGRTRRYTFGTTMYLLKHWGYDPQGEVFGQFKIQADREINSRFIQPQDIIADQKCVLVKSEKGTGKTEIISTLANAGLNVLIAGHRKNLLRNTTVRTNIPNYLMVTPSEAKSLAITIDSLHKLNLQRQHFDMIIIDEVEQVLAHLTGDTLRENRATELTIFRWLLQKADKIVCFDADLSFVSVNFFKRLLGEGAVFIVENVHKVGGKTIEMYPSEYDIRAQVELALRQDLKIAVATNSRRDALNLNRVLLNLFPEKKIVCITQDNSDDKAIQEFVENISEAVVGIDALIYSPSLGTGVSIDPAEPYFDTVFLIGMREVTTHFDLDQQICRVRKIKSGTVKAYVGYMFPDEEQKVTDAAVLKKICVDNSFETGVRIRITSTGAIEADTSDYWYIELWADIMSLRNMSLNNLNKCFVRLMEDQGHTVKYMAADKNLRQDAKSKSKNVQDILENERVKLIMAARDMDELDYQETVAKDEMTREDKAAVEKFDLKDFYQQEVTEDLIVLDDQGKFRETIVLGEMVAGYQDAKHFDETEAAVKNGLLGAESRVMIPHRKFYGPKRDLVQEALVKAGLGELTRENVGWFGTTDWYSADSLKAHGFVDWIGDKFNQDRLFRHLGITVPVNYQEQASLVLGLILKKLGFSVREQRKRIGGRNGQMVWQRQVEAGSAGRLRAILEARATKYKSVLEGETVRNAVQLDYLDRDGNERSVMVGPEHVVDLFTSR